MPATANKLTSIVEDYLSDLRRVRASGGATGERSTYGPLANLLNDVGATLRPKVFCVGELAEQGAGHPDFGLYAAKQLQRGKPRDGQLPECGVVEVKPPDDDAWLIAESDQVSRYWERYRLVLVTNTRDFVLLGEDSHGNPAKLETFRLADSKESFVSMLEKPRVFARHVGPEPDMIPLVRIGDNTTLLEDKDIHSLSRLLDDGLDAGLALDCESVMRWKDEAPLRLVTAALLDSDNREDRTKDLRERLTSRVIDPDDWPRWWKRVQPALKESRQFRYRPESGGRIRLIAKPAEIEHVSWNDLPAPARSTPRPKTPKPRLSPTARLAEWITWVQADVAPAIPESTPPDDLLPILRTLPLSVTPVAIQRLIAGIEERVIIPGRRAPKVSQAWINALVATLRRWSESTDAPDISLIQITDLAARALDIPSSDEDEMLVTWLAHFISKRRSNSDILADALQLASQKTPTSVDNMLAGLRRRLDMPDIVTLWKALVRASLSLDSGPTSIRWLALLEIDEKSEVFSSLLSTVRDEDSVLKLGNLLQREWAFVSHSQQKQHLFKPMAIGWLLHDQLRPQFRRIMLEFTTNFHIGDHTSGNSIIGNWKGMVQSAAKEEIGQLRVEKDQQLAEKDQKFHEVRKALEETEADLHRAGRQNKYLQGELRKVGHVTSLRLSRDALLVLGGTIQDIAASPAPLSASLADVNAKVVLALAALGAEPFGEVSEIVPYEPAVHELDDPPVAGAPVRIIAPGLKYTRDVDTPLVLIRMQVRLEKLR